MNASQPVRVTRTFQARPERVFAAFEDPEELAQWMGQPGSETRVHVLDVREGGVVELEMRWDNGMSIRLHGTFLQVDKPSLLKFTWAMAGDDANSGVVTVEIKPFGTGAELTLTHEGLTGPALAQSKAGWNGWFNQLQGLVESD